MASQLASASTDEQRSEVQMKILDEQNNKEQQKQENILRRHNFFPLILNLCQSLAEKGQLQPLFQAAKDRKIASNNERAAEEAAKVGK